MAARYRAAVTTAPPRFKAPRWLIPLVAVGVVLLIIVLPLVGILAARTLAGARGERVLQSVRTWVQRNAPAVLAGTLTAIGLAGVVFGVAGLA